MKRPVPARVVVSVFFAALTLLFILAASPKSTSAITPSFTVGQRVATVGTTNVRAVADGALLGTQPKGATGAIVAGPVTVSGNAVIWYEVTFLTGNSGWVGGDMLIGGSSAPKAIAVGTHFFFEESAGVTVYVFDGTDYKKERFLKGATLSSALKKYGAKSR